MPEEKIQSASSDGGVRDTEFPDHFFGVPPEITPEEARQNLLDFAEIMEEQVQQMTKEGILPISSEDEISP